MTELNSTSKASGSLNEPMINIIHLKEYNQKGNKFRFTHLIH